MAENLIIKPIEDEMKEAYIDYAMSVIMSRALPDVRDGLKPVHRRILYTMLKLGLQPNKSFKKCARIVGDTLGRFHPHGDLAVYDALVRMAQDFSLRYPLVNGQGNFGCFTGDTKVELTDGRKLSFKDLVKEFNQGKKNYTYTVTGQGLVQTGEIKKPRLTKKSASLIKVTLNNKEEIKCTPDHRFMLRDGSYKEAQNLKKDDSLMSLKIKQAKLHNHKVIRVEYLNQKEDVYDLTIDGTHNFALASGVFVHNSVDGDTAAHQRYTEAKMTRIAEEMLQDIDKKTVKFVPNFDESLKEPSVLPAKVPNLLLNGTSGIAVGMATNIPPHNLTNVVDTTIQLIDNPDINVDELIKTIIGPDFPTGGIICGRSGLIQAYQTGRGKIRVRGKTSFEPNRVIIDEIPYAVNKTTLIESIANLVKEKRIEGIRDIRDESDRKGMRVVIELKKNENQEIIVNQLFKNTQLQVTFGANMLSIVDNAPKIMGLKGLLEEFIKHRFSVVTRRTKFELEKAEDRMHIVDGLLIALQNIDAVVKLIRASADAVVAKTGLIEQFKLSEKQSLAILDMRLQRLTNLETKKLADEKTELVKLVTELKDILGSKDRRYGIIKTELTELRDKYGDERRTEVIDSEEDFEVEDLIAEENVVVMCTRDGYLKRLSLEEYKQQNRGGVGIMSSKTKDEDVVEQIFTSSSHYYILLFTNQGRVHWLKTYKIPESSRYSRGKALVNLINMQPDEKVTAMLPVAKFYERVSVMMATKNGVLKQTPLTSFSRPMKRGIRAINLRGDDQLVTTRLSTEQLQFMLCTQKGMAIKFKSTDVRKMGRTASGVRGIRLKEGDAVIGLEVARTDATLFTITENGFGKRTNMDQYRLIKRGGKGVTNIKTSERNGSVVGIKTVMDHDELLITSAKGIVIRIATSSVRTMGRSTQGVRIMKLRKEDKVKCIARIIHHTSDANNKENKND
ncbi:DNA gyrase subunit A [archaeon]|nr:DNA gyrase subunit A [archaeon]